VTWTTPRTWVVGDLVTAAMMNANVRDNLNALVGVTGRVSAAGAIVGGSGFTVVRSATGTYSITFNSALISTPVVLVALTDTAAAAHVVSNTTFPTPTTTGFGVRTLNTSFVNTDCAFNFLARPTI
jgi:hypothetical protein